MQHDDVRGAIGGAVGFGIFAGVTLGPEAILPAARAGAVRLGLLFSIGNTAEQIWNHYF